MLNLDQNAKSVLLGAVIGGLVGVGVVAVFRAYKNDNSSLGAIGETIARMGELVKDHIDDPQFFVKEIDKKIEKNEDKLSAILEWTAAGIDLWKKLKKGD